MSAAAFAAVGLAAIQARAQDEYRLTLPQAVALAAERAAPIQAGRARVGEARGRLLGAEPWLRDNPEVELGAGPRRSSAGSSIDLLLELRQPIELPGRRGARIASAEAGVHHEAAALDDLLRTYAGEVGRAFVAVVHARERLDLLRQDQEIAARLLSTAQRRRSAGDASVLELNVSRAADAQGRARMLAAEGDLAWRTNDLARALSLPAGAALAVVGSLNDLASAPVGESGSPSERPDVRAARAELDQARADLELGGAEAWPDLALGAEAHREGQESFLLGTLSVSIPVFARGQQTRAEAAARARRAQAELEAADANARRGAAAARERWRRTLEAVRLLDSEALPVAVQNGDLAARGYAAGELPLAELMLIRREALEVRTQYLDLLLEAAGARLDLAAELGVSP
ncbi:MAG TPA: TolC family protein [Myxococcaceae bacterium]